MQEARVARCYLLRRPIPISCYAIIHNFTGQWHLFNRHYSGTLMCDMVVLIAMTTAPINCRVM